MSSSPTNANAYEMEMMSVSDDVRSRLFYRDNYADGNGSVPESLPSEQEEAKWYHFLVYAWASPLLSRGAFRHETKTEMPASDLLRLPTYEQPRTCMRVLKREWEREVKELAPAKGRIPSLPLALLRAFWPRLVAGGICRFMSDGFSFVSPFLLKELLRWLQSDNSEEPVWEGFVLVIAIALSNLFMSWFLNGGSLNTTCAFAQMSNGLQLLVYEKILAQHPEHGETGHLTTLHASDVQRLQMLAIPIHGIWVTPFLVIGACIALYVFMGWAGVIAMGAMILSSPLQAFLTRKLMGYRTTIVKIADRRVNAINEVLQGIRICKFMNWEANFEERIAKIREEEIAQLRLSYFMRAAVTMIGNAMPSIVSVILFGVAYAMEGQIEPTRVFPAISMLNVVRIPMLMLPMAIAAILETNVSIKRVRDFLLRPDAEQYVTRTSVIAEGVGGSVDLNNVTVTSRDKKVTILSNLSCHFPASKLSIIHGPTGCGKSTLVKALIGEATVDTATLGHVKVGGSLAYMSQEAWIMNATVRENIIMDMPFDTKRYWRVVRACQLMDDFKQLANGDMTEIGERGVNLSGGQKQRISFARAAYSDKDIVVMDDPLSAVDAHVCKRLFEDCIVGFMKGKTRILVTHQTQFLGRCDNVVEMADRKVAFCGPVSELEGVEILEEEDKPAMDDDAEPEQHSAPLMAKEQMVLGEVSWGVYAWFIQLGTLSMTVSMLALFGVWRASSVVADMWLTWWSNRAEPFGRSYTDKDYLMCFGITTAISIALIYFRQMVLALFTINVCRQSHAAMVSRLIRAPTSFFDTTPMGRILNRFTKDMDGLDVRIPDLLSQILMTSFNLFGMLVLVAITTPFILALLPILAFAVRLIYVQYARTQRAVKQIESVSRSPVLAVVNETLGGLSTIRAFGMVDHFRHKHDTRADISARPAYNVRCAQRWLSARTEIIGTVILFFAAYICAISKVTGAGLGVSARVVGLSLTYVISTTNAVTFLNRSFAEFEADMNSTERIMEYSTEVAQERDVVYDKHDNPAPSVTWAQNGSISFKNISLRYRPCLPLVLKGVSFNVSNGMKVGVVGRTGSGKSTIILTLFRMLELEGGSIVMDGRDIAQVGLSDLRKRITIIPQDPVLFAGTLRSNLDPFRQYSDAELWDALDKSNIKERIEGDAAGLDCPVTEKGANFSVGERQLLCMARAILRRCSILLLDEATASVDYKADQLIQDTIRSVFRDCTVITVAHRLSTIIDADKVVVMGDGQVLEDAAPHELLQKSDGVFAGMVRQLGDEEFSRLKEVAKEHYKGSYAHKTVVVKD